MNREFRRRLLLRAHTAAKRFCKREEGKPYFMPATDAFVAGWLLGYRAHRRDFPPKPMQVKDIWNPLIELAPSGASWTLPDGTVRYWRSSEGPPPADAPQSLKDSVMKFYGHPD